MSSKKIFSSVLLIITLLSMNFSSFAAVQVRAADTSQIEVSKEISVFRVYYESPEQIQQLMAFDLFEFNNLEEKYVLVALTADEVKKVEEMGFVTALDKEESANFELLSTISQNQLNTIPGYSCYRTVEETYATAANIASLYPNLATWTDVGDSWEKSVGQSDGYDLLVLKLTNKSITGDKPKLFITGSIHAREYTAAELATRYAEYLVNNYNVDADITWLLDYHEIHLLLQMNPDGRKEAESGRSWRKNTNENYCGVTSTNRGADLNRNYSFYWNYCSGCSSGSPCDGTYRGPSAASEPEVSAVQAYMRSIFPDQREAALSAPAPSNATGVFIDLHSYSQLVLWPWGMTSSVAPNNSGLQTLGRKFAFFNSYTPQRSYQLYGTDGDSIDYAYGDLGIAAYTFELGTAFFQSCSTFENTIVPTNLPALLYAAKVARTPYMTPLGPDTINLAVSSSTVPAGTAVTLTGVANDTRYKSGSGEATQAIAQAEYYIDTPPWVEGAAAIPMSASDGSFNSTAENLTASVNTAGWNQGRHTLYLRSQDAAGNWGAISAIFLSVEFTDNEPPVADDKVVSTTEDAPVLVILTGSDPDDDPLTFSVVNGPVNGTLNGTVPDLTYTPSINYNGPDSFTYKANDGIADSDLATVSITIAPVNDAPLAEDQSVSTEVNSPVAITLVGSDVEGASLAYSVLTNPEHGSLSGTAPELLYTPDTGYTGSDGFTFKVSDSALDSETATVTITINPPGPIQVFWDDFESDLGWVEDPEENDSATTGIWELDDPETVDYNGYKQLGDPVSGTHDLVTGHLAGSSAGDYDIDGGVTTIRSPEISLPVGRDLTLSFYYYLAHSNNANADDFLRVTIEGATNQMVFEELGAADDDDAVWEYHSADISAFAGQTITLLIAAADAGTASLVEAAVDDVLIQGLLTNNPPIADPQSITTDEDTAVSITLTGSDPDGGLLTYGVIDGPDQGSLSGVAPALTYTPSTDYHGSDSFTFKVNDGTEDSSPATVSITVTAVNDAPVAAAQSVTTAEDTAKAITLSGSDPDGNPLTYSVVGSPAHGTLSGTAPNLTYTPAANYNGSDSFTFKVNDGTVDSSPATVSITITPVNDAPVANGQSVSTAEDTAKAITLLGTDADGNNLTYSVASQPAHGTLSGSAPNVTYTPATNYNGTDSFTFKVNDGTVDSAPAIVSIDVTPVNDAPVANPQQVVTTENVALSITLTGSDIEGTSLIFSVTSGPSNGTLTGSGATLLYTPNANFEGEDSFTFTANDGDLTSAPATVSITVTRTNAAPVAIGQNVSTNEDVPVGITLTGTDADYDPLDFEVSVEPLHGSLSGTAPNLTYTPASNYHGSDSFSFVVNDGLVDSEAAVVNITIASVNDAPIANSQSKSVIEDTPSVITLTGSDVDGDSLEFSVETGPDHGSLSGIAPNLTYTPFANYNGSDSFIFKVFDGFSYSGTAEVSLTVTAVNDAPLANPQSVTLSEDGSVAIVLTGSDIEESPLSFVIQTQPTHGSLSGTGANRTYTPTANYYGNDSFTFVVNDGETDSVPAIVTISIGSVNDAPVALPQTLSVDEDTTLNVTLTGSDVDMDGLAFTVLNNPSSGTLSGTIPDLVYTPAANFNGSDMFTFTVSDGTLISSSATISLTVRPVNDLPMAMGQAVVTDENTPVNITLEAEDIDGDTLTYTIDVGPQHGVLSGSIPNLVYTPDDYYSGIDSFSFYVSDGNAISNSANVTVQILDFNYLPIVFNQTLSTNENTPLSITLTGMDPDGDMLDFFIISPPENGNLSGTAPDLVYTPNSGYTGSDSFTFAATDNQGESNVGVISIQVNAAGPATVFFDDFETSLGWVRNPFGTDTATLGYFERANPDSVAYYGDKQLGTTVSGSYDLVTGPLAGSSAGAYDLDGGKTSVLSPTIDLPVGRELTLSFSYYVSHYTNSSNADYLRVFIIGDSTVKVFEELGANNDDDAVWDAFSADISSFAGQSIQILIEAADASTASYFEAAVDDVGVVASTPNNPPVAVGGSYELAEDSSVPLSLSGSDPEGDTITFQVTTSPSHGTLVGTAPNLTYIPAANYFGSDSFVFVTNDGKLNSEPAIITLDITAVNDAPLAVEMNLSTTVDVPFSFSLSGTDVEGDELSYTVSVNPSQGVLSGTAPNLIYTPTLGYIGPDSFQFTVNDGSENSLPATVSITVNPAGPTTIFWDDFETDQGWVRNPFGTDTARLGYWERANPDTVSYSGYKQLGTTVSGSYDLVTGPSAGSSAGSYDLDGGITSIQSPYFTLPTGRNLVLSLKYYMAHANNSSSSDYLRVKIVGTSTQTILQELGARNDDDAAWATLSISLNTFAGQTVYLLIEASDSPSESLVEAAIDDVLIIAE